MVHEKLDKEVVSVDVETVLSLPFALFLLLTCGDQSDVLTLMRCIAALDFDWRADTPFSSFVASVDDGRTIVALAAFALTKGLFSDLDFGSTCIRVGGQLGGGVSSSVGAVWIVDWTAIVSIGYAFRVDA